jgi:hypothetical protein
VTVTGPARSLLLTLTQRLPLTDREATGISVDGDTGISVDGDTGISVDGDTGLAQHWLDNTAHVSG